MIKFIFLALLILPLAACNPESDSNDANILVVETYDQKHKFKVELAVTREEQARGLMNRSEMAEDAGMLFFFGSETERSFWMKNTLIPLDIIFIKEDGLIHYIHHEAVPGDLTSIRSRGDVAAALEINGGLAKKLGINPGNKVKHPFFEPNDVE